MMSIRHVSWRQQRFPLRYPFVTAAGRKTATTNLEVCIELVDGTQGWGEASTSLALKHETIAAMAAVCKRLKSHLIDSSIEDLLATVRGLWRAEPAHPTAVAALECALWDAAAQRQGRPLYKLLGGHQKFIETDITISLGEPKVVAERAKEYSRDGFRRLKVKLGKEGAQKNLMRLLAAREGAPKAQLLADGNQGFTLTDALLLSDLLKKHHLPIVFFEQPFHKDDVASMQAFRKKSRIPLLADESVFTAKDAERLFQAKAADGVNIKIAKSGITESLEIIRVTRRLRKKLSIGCMEESQRGLAASVHLACGQGGFDWVDLDSAFLLKPGLLRGGFTNKGAMLSVKDMGIGLGFAPRPK